ncbi:MAG: sulfite exporter TauE/SafE family protein [Verrucomicrobia bacterium]|nr:sulfite exporter TauE/SafE family protein [Verrucomicrobiota bacterium]
MPRSFNVSRRPRQALLYFAAPRRYSVACVGGNYFWQFVGARKLFGTADSQLKTVLSIFTGFIAGTLHVVSGPDHLAAIAPLAADQRRGAWRTGLRWGLGHASGVVAVGMVSLLLREVFPLEKFSAGSEQLVGVVLIGIGLWGLRRVFRARVHTHEHQHDGRPHTHLHVHGRAAHGAHEAASAAPHAHTHAAFAVGALHGLAGSAHFLGVLPALAFSSGTDAVTYLACYGAGTVLAMSLFSSLVGWMSGAFAGRDGGPQRALMGLCSVFALVVGGFWLVG